MKKLLLIAAAVVALVAVVSFFLISNLDALVAKVIEKNGGGVTRTDVRVSGVKIALRDGRGTIEGLTVANPDGYRASHAFTLEDITIAIDLKSLRRDPVVIDEIRIKAPVVHAEFTATGSLNLDELKKRIEEYAARSGGEDDGPEKRIRIMRFVFEKGSVEVDLSALDLEKRTVVLPAIDLSDIGGPTGATPDGIAKTVLSAVAGRAASEVARSGIDRLIEEKLGGSITDKARDLLQKIAD